MEKSIDLTDVGEVNRLEDIEFSTLHIYIEGSYVITVISVTMDSFVNTSGALEEADMWLPLEYPSVKHDVS